MVGSVINSRQIFSALCSRGRLQVRFGSFRGKLIRKSNFSDDHSSETEVPVTVIYMSLRYMSFSGAFTQLAVQFLSALLFVYVIFRPCICIYLYSSAYLSRFGPVAMATAVVYLIIWMSLKSGINSGPGELGTSPTLAVSLKINIIVCILHRNRAAHCLTQFLNN